MTAPRFFLGCPGDWAVTEVDRGPSPRGWYVFRQRPMNSPFIEWLEGDDGRPQPFESREDAVRACGIALGILDGWEL